MIPESCSKAGLLAEEILSHAKAFCGLPNEEALQIARRVLFAEGLCGLLRGAPQDLLERVETLERKECVELLLMRRFRTTRAAS